MFSGDSNVLDELIVQGPTWVHGPWFAPTGLGSTWNICHHTGTIRLEGLKIVPRGTLSAYCLFKSFI